MSELDDRSAQAHPDNLIDLAAKARWCWKMARTLRRSLGNLVGHVVAPFDLASQSAWSSEQFDLRQT